MSEKKLILRGGGACPEQYDVFLDGKKVAYFRLRHGAFTAQLTDGKDGGTAGTIVYTACPEGDGCFQPEERNRYLNWACRSVLDALAGIKTEEEPLLFEIATPGEVFNWKDYEIDFEYLKSLSGKPEATSNE